MLELISSSVVENLSNGEPEFLVKKRLEAFAKFQQMQIPTAREEEWRHIGINEKQFVGIIVEPRKLNFPKPEILKDGVIFTDIISAAKEFPDIVQKYFGTVVPVENKFQALHYSVLNSGTFLYIPHDVEVEVPLRSSFFIDEVTGNFMHTLIVVEPGASVTYIEDLSSPTTANIVYTDATEILVKESAKLKLISLQNWGLGVQNFASRRAVLDKNASLDWYFSAVGCKYAKLNYDVVLQGEGAVSKNFGVFFGMQKQNIGVFTNAFHKVSNTTYDIKIKGVLKDYASSVCRGLIKIEKDAVKSSGSMSAHTLLLSETAKANVIPSLVIDNNDVQASHAASVGQIDEERLFYLMSRGLDRKSAEKLVVEGFFDPIVRNIPQDDIKERLVKIIQERMSSGS